MSARNLIEAVQGEWVAPNVDIGFNVPINEREDALDVEVPWNIKFVGRPKTAPSRCRELYTDSIVLNASKSNVKCDTLPRDHLPAMLPRSNNQRAKSPSLQEHLLISRHIYTGTLEASGRSSSLVRPSTCPSLTQGRSGKSGLRLGARSTDRSITRDCMMDYDDYVWKPLPDHLADPRSYSPLRSQIGRKQDNSSEFDDHWDGAHHPLFPSEDFVRPVFTTAHYAEAKTLSLDVFMSPEKQERRNRLKEIKMNEDSYNARLEAARLRTEMKIQEGGDIGSLDLAQSSASRGPGELGWSQSTVSPSRQAAGSLSSKGQRKVKPHNTGSTYGNSLEFRKSPSKKPTPKRTPWNAQTLV